jgi:hypothetical protein
VRSPAPALGVPKVGLRGIREESCNNSPPLLTARPKLLIVPILA